MPKLPEPRGEISEGIFEALAGPAGARPLPTARAAGDPLEDEDLQLALYCAYELHYRGFDDVDERWEWEPALLAFRAALEAPFEEAVRAEAGPCEAPPPELADVALREIADSDESPSLSMYIAREGTLDQALEFLVHRSAYQLKEADPHSWAIPRLTGPPKAALVEVQADEYGGGRPDRMHSTLFAKAMRAMGLDASYGAYLSSLPAPTLATVNLMSLFGLHRRLRGAIAGHLALFEMTSSIPNRRYADGLRRLGAPPEALDFFDEHVEADAVHENIAAVDLAGGLMRHEPEVSADVILGARALAALDARWAERVLEAWQSGESSLRPSRNRPRPRAGPATSGEVARRASARFPPGRRSPLGSGRRRSAASG